MEKGKCLVNKTKMMGKRIREVKNLTFTKMPTIPWLFKSFKKISQ